MNTTTVIASSRLSSRSATRTDSDLRFVTATILFVLVITSLPYLFGYLTTPHDKQFMGLMLDVPDHLQYFSWMRELSHANLAANKLTPEPNQPVFFNLLWWTMGRLGQALGWGYAGMYQLLRVVATTLFLLLTYRVCSWFLDDRLSRRTAFLLVVFTSGFGWMLVLLKYTVTKGQLLFPLDLFVAEGNTFLDILGYPHFIAAALYVVIFDLVLRGQVKQDWRYPIAAGLIAFILGWQHAYDLVIIYGVLFTYTALSCLRDRSLPRFLIVSGFIIGGISVWPALYSVILTSSDPIWAKVLAQFANAGVYTPNLLHLPILLGPAFLLALWTALRGSPWRLKLLSNNALFLQAWFWTIFFLIYLPVDYQIHMLNGWQIPIAILAVQGLFRYGVPWVQSVAHDRQWRWSDIEIRKALAIALVTIILPTNLYLLAWRFVDLQRHDYPYYLYKDEIAAFTWLDAHVQPDDVVLSSLTTGQYIPAMTGAHAFLAHWAQTVSFFTKSDMVNHFFASETKASERRQIVNQFDVQYVLYGPSERMLGKFDPVDDADFTLVFSTPSVNVFKVAHAAK